VHQRAHVRAAGAVHLEVGGVGGEPEPAPRVDADRARCTLHGAAAAGDVVQPLALVLERRDHGWDLLQFTGERDGGVTHGGLVGTGVGGGEHASRGILRIGHRAEACGARVGLAASLPHGEAARRDADREHQ
jgi:hypothetical protein